MEDKNKGHGTASRLVAPNLFQPHTPKRAVKRKESAKVTGWLE